MSGAEARAERMGGFRQQVADFASYIAQVRQLSPHTVRAYEGDLESFCAWLEREGIDPYDVSHRQMRRWLAEQSRARYANSTIDRRMSAVRDLYRWLVARGLSEKDCAAAVSSPKRAKTLPRTMSTSDVERLLTSCDESDPAGLRDRAFLELLAASGARISEMSRLDVGDVDLPGMQLRLFGKGSKERIVPMYQGAADIVARYLDEARPSLLAAGAKLSEAVARDAARALFVSTRGRRMSADALRTRFERQARLAGLGDDVTPHAMRHTYATELLAGGADMRSVQELLGHANLATTQIYTHLSVERLKEATRQAHPRAQ
jgi:integrase/recombinase XerD